MKVQTLIIPLLNLETQEQVSKLNQMISEVENLDSFFIDLSNKSVSLTAKKMPKVAAKVFQILKQNNFKIDSVVKNYPVLNMTCASCASSSQANLKRQPGVVNAEVNYGNGMGKIEYIPSLTSPENLKNALVEVGFDLVIDESKNQDEEIEQLHEDKYLSLKKNVIWALVFGIPLFI